MAQAPYRIERLKNADLPLIWAWLQEPHVQAWWVDPQVQFDLIKGDMDDPTIDLHLVSLGDQPFAYVQDYCVQDWMQPHLKDRPEGTRAIDTFLGDPAFLGRGHGAGLLRQHALDLLARGTPQIVIDPDPENSRAIAAYARSGFIKIGVRESDEGPALLMVFDPNQASLAEP